MAPKAMWKSYKDHKMVQKERPGVTHGGCRRVCGRDIEGQLR